VNSYELHRLGVLPDAEVTLRVALVSDGWPADAADSLITAYAEDVADVAARAPRRQRRWTADELDAIDQVLDESSDLIPGVAVTRPLAERLGRSHKALLSAIERRIDTRTRLAAGYPTGQEPT